ncbi:hypothetical protein Hanom_Chr02g00095221 [Helianthus anomalus]
MPGTLYRLQGWGYNLNERGLGTESHWTEKLITHTMKILYFLTHFFIYNLSEGGGGLVWGVRCCSLLQEWYWGRAGSGLGRSDAACRCFSWRLPPIAVLVCPRNWLLSHKLPCLYLFWVGCYLGWAGDIRGWQVDTIFRYAWRYLVACFLPFLIWSLGCCVYIYPSLQTFDVCRSHKGGIGLICVLGINTNPGDIRMDGFGRMFFRRPLFLHPTPKPNPLGYRNRVGMTNSCFWCLQGTLLLQGWVLSYRWISSYGVLMQANYWGRPQYSMCIQQDIDTSWARGMFVLTGWAKYSQDVFLGRCGSIEAWCNFRGACKWSEVLPGPLWLLFVNYGVLWQSSSWFRQYKDNWWDAWDCCMLNLAILTMSARDQASSDWMCLMLWHWVVWQLSTSANGLISLIYNSQKPWVWLKNFMGTKECRGKMRNRWNEELVGMWTRLPSIWSGSGPGCSVYSGQLPLGVLYERCSVLLLGADPQTGPSFLMCLLKMLELITMFWMYWALNGPSSVCDATIVIWVYGQIGEDIGNHRLIRITNFCGPPLLYGPPSVYTRCSVRFVTHCKAMVLCIPRVGLLVSYFWSPEHVSGDEEGGMPP